MNLCNRIAHCCSALLRTDKTINKIASIKTIKKKKKCARLGLVEHQLHYYCYNVKYSLRSPAFFYFYKIRKKKSHLCVMRGCLFFFFSLTWCDACARWAIWCDSTVCIGLRCVSVLLLIDSCVICASACAYDDDDDHGAMMIMMMKKISSMQSHATQLACGFVCHANLNFFYWDNAMTSCEWFLGAL